MTIRKFGAEPARVEVRDEDNDQETLRSVAGSEPVTFVGPEAANARISQLRDRHLSDDDSER